MDVRELRRTLLSKLQAVEDRKRDHIFFYFDIQGKQYRATKLSHSLRGQLGATLEGLIAKQLRLHKEALVALVECPLSKDDYFRIWSERSQESQHA